MKIEKVKCTEVYTRRICLFISFNEECDLADDVEIIGADKNYRTLRTNIVVAHNELKKVCNGTPCNTYYLKDAKEKFPFLFKQEKVKVKCKVCGCCGYFFIWSKPSSSELEYCYTCCNNCNAKLTGWSTKEQAEQEWLEVMNNEGVV